MQLKTRPDCRLCGSQGTLVYSDLHDRLFSAQGTWSIRQCSNRQCGLAWLDPEPAMNDFADLYRGYYTHRLRDDTQSWIRLALRRVSEFALWLASVNAERDRLRLLYQERSPPGSLLEVGCGSGERLAEFKRLGWQVVGQEIDPMAAAAAERRSGVKVYLGTVDNLVATGASFDVVVMNHVIEHVADPVDLLRSCRRLLRVGGQLVCVTPNIQSWGHRYFGRNWLALDPPRHIVLFTHRALESCARAAGFDSVLVWSTSANTQAFAAGSVDIRDRGRYDMTRPSTLRTSLTAFVLQFVARAAYRVDRDSGDELVLKCRL